MATTTIKASLKRPGQLPQAGKIRVKLTHPIKDEDTIYTTEQSDFPLVNGEVTFTLLTTDISQVPYTFQLVKTETLTPTPPDEGEPFDVEVVVWSFEALVPYSATTIDLADLFEDAGIAKDYRDQSILNLVRYLGNSTKFIDALMERIFKHQGTWLIGSIYRVGNLVTDGTNTYIYVNTQPSSGNALSDVTYWRKLV